MSTPPDSAAQRDAGALRPFDPQRPKKGLFVFSKDPSEAPPIATFREALEIRSSAGLQGDELREFWAEHWHRHEFDLDALYPFIVRAAWRLTRALALAKGKLAPDQFLGEMDQSEWDTPTNGNVAGTSASLERHLTVYKCALLPPPPPVEWTDGSKDASYYDPASDVDLCAHVDRIGVLSRRLGIGMRKEGRLGLAPLLELAMVRAAWPTPREIMAYESVMADEVSEALLKYGHLGMRREIQKQHGLSEDETISMVMLARKVMRGLRVGSDADVDKATMVARLEDLAARCRQNLDLRAELMVYKTLAIVQGLTKTQGGEEDVDDMVEVAGEVAAETPLLDEGDELEIEP